MVLPRKRFWIPTLVKQQLVVLHRFWVSGDRSVQERIDVHTGIKMILKLCIADGFDMFPTLLVTDGSCMIDCRMGGIHGHPLEMQVLFFSALLCAREMLTREDGSADLLRALNNRLVALFPHQGVLLDRLKKTQRDLPLQHRGVILRRGQQVQHLPGTDPSLAGRVDTQQGRLPYREPPTVSHGFPVLFALEFLVRGQRVGDSCSVPCRFGPHRS